MFTNEDAPPSEYLDRERGRMVARIIEESQACAPYTGRARLDDAVLDTLARVPRHRFVPAGYQSQAYINAPLAIGHGQTISQPFMVALMTDLLDLGADARVLEIGTGSGYQTAVLAELAAQVYSLEIVPALAERARGVLEELGYRNVQIRCADGHQGWAEHAPYDGILVAAAADRIPAALVKQLRPGGRMVIPVGPPGAGQTLVLATKTAAGFLEQRPVLQVVFVPFVSGGPLSRDP